MADRADRGVGPLRAPLLGLRTAALLPPLRTQTPRGSACARVPSREGPSQRARSGSMWAMCCTPGGTGRQGFRICRVKQ